MEEQIDIQQMAKEMSREDLEQGYCDVIFKVTELTQAIGRKHPLIMGKGDGAIDTAIKLITECQCR